VHALEPVASRTNPEREILASSIYREIVSLKVEK
jgi:hypothetical protein